MLAYLREYLLESPLEAFLDEEGEGTLAWEEVGKGASLLETVDAQLGRREAGQPYAQFLTSIGWLVGELEGKATVVFEDVARAQRRGVRFGEATRVILEKDIERVDASMDALYRDVSLSPSFILTRPSILIMVGHHRRPSIHSVNCEGPPRSE